MNHFRMKFAIRARLLCTVVVGTLLLPAILDAALSGPGDIAFVGFDTTGVNSEDDLAFVPLVDIDPGQTIFFNDEEWTGASFTTGGEGIVSWTNDTGAAIGPGTVISILNLQDDSPNLTTASIGTADEIDTNLSLPVGSETVYAYIGSTASPTFLTALDYGSGGSGATLAGTGLSFGTSALDLTSQRQYTGDRSSQPTFGSYTSLVNDPSNWGAIGTSTAPSTPGFNTTNFTTAIPEPSSSVFLLGIVLCVALKRRKIMLGS